jgi:hypothetical protein
MLSVAASFSTSKALLFVSIEEWCRIMPSRHGSPESLGAVYVVNVQEHLLRHGDVNVVHLQVCSSSHVA